VKPKLHKQKQLMYTVILEDQHSEVGVAINGLSESFFIKTGERLTVNMRENKRAKTTTLTITIREKAS